MPVDLNNQYTGKLFGQDRIGQTTPDLELSEPLKPWLPVPYPAPYLPGLRQDQGHPKLASVVLSSQHLIGQDKSGALVPSGLQCGKTPAGSNVWCIIQWGAGSIDQFTIDPRTGNAVTPGDHCVLAAPADAAPGNVTLTNGTVIAVSWTDINWAWNCTLFPSVTTGTTLSGSATNVPLVPMLTPSSAATKSTLVYTLAAAGDSFVGQLVFQVGAAGTPATVEFNGTLAAAATAVTAAITALAPASAVTAANAALTAANTALTTANTAVTTANTALTAANVVVTTAGNTVTATDLANQSAALAAYNTALANLATAQTTQVAAQAAYTAVFNLNAVTVAATTTTLTLTGVVDGALLAGTNSFVFTSDIDDVGHVGTAVPYSYGTARPIGVCTRNVFQYIGGVKIIDKSLAGGILYRLEGLNPIGFQVMNYMHEMGTAIQTQYVLKVPWIGATPNTLQQDATTDGIQGYVQGYGRTFAHFTGLPTTGAGVTFSQFQNDQGNYTVFNPAVNSPVDLVGRIIGVVNMINKIGFSNRIKTLWDPSRMVGPMTDPNPAAIMMGGSATAGLPYDLNLTTDGIYKASQLQKTQARPEYGTYVLVRVLL